MKINFSKTKLIKFNPCKEADISPDFEIGGHKLEVISQIRLLGVVLTSDLKFKTNTEQMITRAYKKLWMLRRLKHLGATSSDLVDVYFKQIRSLVEYAVPVWQSSISQCERVDLERIQKSACHIILGKQYVSYSQALLHLNIESLESRRRKLCLRFALKAEKHPKFSRWFKPVRVNVHPRTCKPFKKYQDVFAYTGRAAKSLLNFYYNNEMKKKKSIYLIIFLEGEL